MSDLTFPPPNPENVELAAANRRLTTAILGMVLLTGLVACMAYLAGRTVTHIRTETSATVRNEVAHGPVVVNPLPAKAAGQPAGAVEAKPVQEAAIPESTEPAPAPGPGLYLQVGLMDPLRDRTMQYRLTKSGFSVWLSPMEDSPNSRVLVGPILSPAQQKEMEAKLAAEGYQFFQRRF